MDTGTRTTIKTLPDMSAARRYAAACLRRERDPRITFIPTQNDSGQWAVVKIDRRR